MADSSYKRSRRPDHRQGPDGSDRRVALPSRGRDGRDRRDEYDDRRRQDDRNRDRDWDRDGDRRYRDRSPRDLRAGRDRDHDRARDRRDDDPADDKKGGRGRDNRGNNWPGKRNEDDRWDFGRRGRDGGRDAPRERFRERSRSREGSRDNKRSRSPRRERDKEEKWDKARDGDQFDGKKSAGREAESRNFTPPVNSKAKGKKKSSDNALAQDHDRMDISQDEDSRKAAGKTRDTVEESNIEEDDEIIIEDDSMAAMQAMMGFGGFGTTHQKKVAGNNVSAIRKEKKTEYRQYMNRVGGFNRPLSPSRE